MVTILANRESVAEQTADLSAKLMNVKYSNGDNLGMDLQIECIWHYLPVMHSLSLDVIASREFASKTGVSPSEIVNLAINQAIYSKPIGANGAQHNCSWGYFDARDAFPSDLHPRLRHIAFFEQLSEMFGVSSNGNYMCKILTEVETLAEPSNPEYAREGIAKFVRYSPERYGSLDRLGILSDEPMILLGKALHRTAQIAELPQIITTSYIDGFFRLKEGEPIIRFTTYQNEEYDVSKFLKVCREETFMRGQAAKYPSIRKHLDETTRDLLLADENFASYDIAPVRKIFGLTPVKL